MDKAIDKLREAAELLDAESQTEPSFELTLTRIALNSAIQLRCIDHAQKHPMASSPSIRRMAWKAR